MNRITLILEITGINKAQASGSIQFYRVNADLPDTDHGSLVMYCGPAIGARLMEQAESDRYNQPVKVEIEPGPLGLRIVSIALDWVSE